MNFYAFREDELNGWSARADRYSNATALATVQSIPTLLASVRLFPQARVLDAGCGPGYAAGAAAALGSVCAGIDFSPAMVSAARKRFPAISFSIGDVEALPVEDASQDAVVSNIVLFHLTEPAKAVMEAFRVLAPGGRFAFSQWCAPAESECYRLLFDVISDHADLTLASPAPNAFDLSDRDHARRLMEDAGFSDVTVVDVPNVLRTNAPSFYDFFMDFGVRIPLIMEKQPLSVQQKVREAIDARAAHYRVDDEYRIPLPSIVVAGQRAR
jgi:ubiquinone/menaquinone biosynthesis C-methylase UbiE